MTGTRRYPIWLTVVPIASLILAACGGGGAGQSPGAEETGAAATEGAAAPSGTTLVGGCPEDGTVVTFWTTHTSPTDITGLTAMVEAYNAQAEGTCAEMIQVPGSETDVAKLLTAVRGGIGPDVYMLDRFTVAERAANGALTELPQAAEMEDQYIEFAWAEVVFEDTPYGLPFDTDARALWYRADLLEAAGADITPLDAANGPATLEEVEAIADAFTTEDADGNYVNMGFVPWVNQGWHYTWGFTHGGVFADLEACEVTPTDAGVVAGYQYLYDFAAERDPEKVARWVSSNYPPNTPDPENPLYTGTLGMAISGDWVISHIGEYLPEGGDLRATWIPVPNEGDESATWAGGWSFVIPQGAREPDAGWEFMQFMAGPEGQRIYVQDTAHQSTLNELIAEESLFEGQHTFFRDLLEVANSRPPLPVGALYWDALTTAMGEVQLNESTPEEALQRVADEVQPELDQFCG